MEHPLYEVYLDQALRGTGKCEMLSKKCSPDLDSQLPPPQAFSEDPAEAEFLNCSPWMFWFWDPLPAMPPACHLESGSPEKFCLPKGTRITGSYQRYPIFGQRTYCTKNEELSGRGRHLWHDQTGDWRVWCVEQLSNEQWFDASPHNPWERVRLQTLNQVFTERS